MDNAMKMGCKTIRHLTLVVAAALSVARAEPLTAELSKAESSRPESALSNKSLSDSAALSQSGNPATTLLNPTQLLQELYAGVVVNQTITLVGQDFYQNFVAAWRDKPLSDRYVLSVHERPSARLGSQVWVEYANRKVFQTFLPPARARARDAGLEAVEVAYQNIVDTDVLNLLFRSPDLGADELN